MEINPTPEGSIEFGWGCHTSITVIIPVHNRHHLFPKTLQSVLTQSHAPHRIIVIDDGSQPPLSKTGDPRMTWLTHPKNKGVSASRNTGIKATDTSWIAFLDSDDLWEPGYLEAIERAIIETDGQADIYFTDLRRTVDDGETRQWTRAKFQIDRPWEMVEDGTPWVIRPRIPMMMQSSCFLKFIAAP